MCDLSNPRFHNEDAARSYLEGIRWPDGTVCAFCDRQSTVRPVRGKSMGKGWYYCTKCQKKFTVRVGSIYERSHIPLHKWVTAMHLMAASKKGISAHQLHRMLGITYKSAWFMAHRIREAMKDDSPAPMGGPGSAVQADETYFGRKKGASRKGGGAGHKHAIVSLVTKDKSRTFHVARADARTARQILGDK